ncbi:hypothetical protein A2U01_0080710, partial [Trifolium medium]|nr:hypothetical protein [Trifolium medium]
VNLKQERTLMILKMLADLTPTISPRINMRNLSIYFNPLMLPQFNKVLLLGK